jgi:hypothetical protein
VTALAEVGDVFETHAELERRRGWEDPTICDGRMVVVTRDDTLWEIECDACRHQAAIPAREIDPSLSVRLQVERVARRREASGIPSELAAVTWGHVADNHPEVLAAARRVAASDSARHASSPRGLHAPDWRQQLGAAATSPASTQPAGLLLTGAVGRGKSWLAAATANAMLEHRALRWISVEPVLRALDRDFKDPLRTEALDLIAGTEALVLDDLDKARGTAHGAAPLYSAIDRRVTAGAPLIVTANLDLDEIAARFPEFGDAIASRLALHCEAFTITGRDRRLERFRVAS